MIDLADVTASVLPPPLLSVIYATNFMPLSFVIPAWCDSTAQDSFVQHLKVWYCETINAQSAAATGET